MWRDRKVSVIFPTYNEKESIYSAITDFFASGYVDEIIVVNNNAVPGTDEQVNNTAAKLVYEKRQGYGYAIWCGFKETTGDIIIISEPDGTFDGKDAVKLLAYSDDFPAVFGTRTTSILIWSGANMGWLLRLGNILVAKLIEFLFDTTTLTDVGCTMKLFKREVINRIEGQFSVGGSHFGPELMLLTILNGIRFIEIPVNYKKRVGASSVTGNKVIALFLGFRMIKLILKYRVKTWFGYGRRLKNPG